MTGRSARSQDCLSKTVCAPPLNTRYPAYYGMQLTSALTVPGSRLVGVTSGDKAVKVHAAVRPDGSLVVLAVNTDPSAAKSVRLAIDGYHAAPAVAVRSYGKASHGISRSRWSAGGVFDLSPSSLTELVLRPGGGR